jgi:hypothetical protein
MSGFLAWSVLNGTPQAITAVQSSSVRYFGRPDADHVEADTLQASLVGSSFAIRLAKTSGELRGFAQAQYVAPGFELNDIGFQTRADAIRMVLSANYARQPNVKLVRDYNVAFYANPLFNTAFEYLGTKFEGELTLGMTNGWNSQFELNYEAGGVDDRVTRGGPAVRNRQTSSIEVELESDNRARAQVEGELQVERGEGYKRGAISVAAQYRLTPGVLVSVISEYETVSDQQFYLQSLRDPAAAVSFGRRYIFAHSDQYQAAVAGRLEVSLSSTIAVDAVVRPFLAAVRYGWLKELGIIRNGSIDDYHAAGGAVHKEASVFRVDPDGTGPRSDFSIKDPSFTRTSMNSNVVVRWELRAGSTLFVAWQNSTERDTAEYLSVAKAAREWRRLGPNAVYTIKFSYLIGH